jgi:hypothetical protein
MKIYIFCGPSLPRETALQYWTEPTYLPPASQGDVYRTSRREPWGIGIIDGYFERVPAIWHKEILWALSRGIHVYGSASMGALRAAELAAFGMVGVGSIYEDFARGVLEDDDEVALVHAASGSCFRASSEAMVNIRRTLSKAAQDCVVSPRTSEILVQIAKTLFYPLRTYERLFDLGLRNGLSSTELQNLKDWLPLGQVDQKRLDAIAMLSRMRDDRCAHPEPQQATFSFAYTEFWDRARRSLGRLRTRRKR